MRNNYKSKITKLLVLTIFCFVLPPIYNTFALNYGSNIGVGFTINPSLSLSISSLDLVIDNLTPGTTADSNDITISVATNASYGYTLSATVGNSTHNNSNLTHSNNTDTFSGIATNANLEALTTDNTWGYSTSLDNGNNWSNYNGLSSSSSTTLLDTNTNNSGNSSNNNNNLKSNGVDTINFKIAARAGNTQPSGIYTGTINFIAVTKVAPMSLLDSFIASGAEMLNGYYKMQDMTHDICNNVDIEESELQLIDIRDNKVYWVAKLKDGNCWMTQNLDLDLSHEVALTSETSDIDPESYGKTIYTAETGYSKDETTGVVFWLPSTIDENGIQRADTIDMVWNNDNASATIPGWSNNNYKPYSADAGDKYRYTSSSSYNENTYGSLESCANNNDGDISGCQHTHFGNYYNWSAAVASNNIENISGPGDQTNSICPKNWKIQNINEIKIMLMKQEVANSLYGEGYTTNGFNKIRIHPLYFARIGFIVSNRVSDLNVSGHFWSRHASSNTRTHGIYISANSIVANGFFRDIGLSIRCIAR